MDEFKLEVGGEYVDGLGNRVRIQREQTGNFFGVPTHFYYESSGHVFPAGVYSDLDRLRPIPE